MIYDPHDENTGRRSLAAEINPTVRLFCLLFLTASYILVNSPFGHLFALAFFFALLYLSQLEFSVLTSAIKRLFPLLVFVTCLNFCFYSPENAFFRWRILAPSVSGAVRGLLVSLKITEIVVIFDMFNALTEPMELLAPLSLLFRPFSLLGIEPEQIAVVLSSSFCFPELLKTKFYELSRLQRSTGTGLKAGAGRAGAAEKLRLLLPVLHEAIQTVRERAALFEARGVPEYLRNHSGLSADISIYDVCALTVCTAFFAVQLIIF